MARRAREPGRLHPALPALRLRARPARARRRRGGRRDGRVGSRTPLRAPRERGVLREASRIPDRRPPPRDPSRGARPRDPSEVPVRGASGPHADRDGGLRQRARDGSSAWLPGPLAGAGLLRPGAGPEHAGAVRPAGGRAPGGPPPAGLPGALRGPAPPGRRGRRRIPRRTPPLAAGRRKALGPQTRQAAWHRRRRAHRTPHGSRRGWRPRLADGSAGVRPAASAPGHELRAPQPPLSRSRRRDPGPRAPHGVRGPPLARRRHRHLGEHVDGGAGSDRQRARRDPGVGRPHHRGMRCGDPARLPLRRLPGRAAGPRRHRSAARLPQRVPARASSRRRRLLHRRRRALARPAAGDTHALGADQARRVRLSLGSARSAHSIASSAAACGSGGARLREQRLPLPRAAAPAR